MKRKSFIFMAFLFFCVCPASAVIVNGDFESGSLDPWENSYERNNPWHINSTNSHSGLFSAHVRTPGSGGTLALKQKLDIGILLDSSSELTFWAYESTSIIPNNIATGLWFSDGTYDQHFIWGAPINTWFFVDASETLHQNAGKVLVAIGFFDQAYGEKWIDDVYLIPEPATILLLGLGGLFLKRRRS